MATETYTPEQLQQVKELAEETRQQRMEVEVLLDAVRRCFAWESSPLSRGWPS